MASFTLVTEDTMGSPELNYVTGDGIEHMSEVLLVKRELSKIGIFLEGFGTTITGVYTKPRPYGFDFDCKQPRSLLELARTKAALSEDNRDTKEGAFSAGQTHGQVFDKSALDRDCISKSPWMANATSTWIHMAMWLVRGSTIGIADWSMDIGISCRTKLPGCLVHLALKARSGR
jgi:hypothetical protein